MSVHPLALLLMALAAAMGAGGMLLPICAALALHEAGHLIAARGLGVRVYAISLMPFGGAVQLANVYALSPARLFAVAFAGPLFSLLGALGTLALAAMPACAPFAIGFFRVNVTLMLFNLLPALPLDGGRMLYALLVRPLGPEHALTLGIGLGRVAASSLAIAAIWGFVAVHRLNISLLACAVFLLSSAGEEREALWEARVGQ